MEIISSQQLQQKRIAIWLMIGVGMIVIQVLLGGITRLTESGLSITEWKPITGTLPPLNESAWQTEFEKYRHTDQFKYVHQYFSLKEFKFIFFWEWFHRLWARMMGMVFLVGFVYFLMKKSFNKPMIAPLILLFILGGLQGAIGWFMVKSGLVPEKYYVGHVELTTHFIAALFLLGYTFWFAMSLLPAMQEKIVSKSANNLLKFILTLFIIQLIYGGFMAGMKAASAAPTWPKINGTFFPTTFFELSPWVQNLFNNKLAVHFIHRTMAYVLFALSIFFFLKTKPIKYNKVFLSFRKVYIILITTQVLLGISALLTATNSQVFIWFGIAHQFTAMLLVLCLLALIFIVKKTKPSLSA